MSSSVSQILFSAVLYANIQHAAMFWLAVDVVNPSRPCRCVQLPELQIYNPGLIVLWRLNFESLKKKETCGNVHVCVVRSFSAWKPLESYSMDLDACYS